MSKDKDKRRDASSPRHVDRPTTTHPIGDASSKPASIEAPGREAMVDTSRPPATPLDDVVARTAALPAAAPVKVQCASCQYGQDRSLGASADRGGKGQRRCRANPPQAHYFSRSFGDGSDSGIHAIAMWPVVQDTDACGHWQNVDLS